MSKEWDQRVDKLTAQIYSVYLMSSEEDIEQVPWSYEDMFAVIGLSTDAQERATMVRGFLGDSLRMRPAFPRPEPREREAVRAYNKWTTRAEKRLFKVSCGVDEYYYTIPDGMLRQMLLFHQEMMRVRVHNHLDTLPVPDYILADDALPPLVEQIIEEPQPPEKVDQDAKEQTVGEPSTYYEMDSDEALLFGERVEKPVEKATTVTASEEPPEGEDLTIPQMLAQVKGTGEKQVYFSNGDTGFLL